MSEHGTYVVTHIDCRHEFLTGGKMWLHAVAGKVVIGSMSIEPAGDDFLWLNDLFVTQECRRNGVACALIDEAVRLGQRQPLLVGCAAGIFRANEPSRQLFLSMGFQHAHTYDTSGQDVLLYSRRFDR